jgi:hypothetical protein
MLQIKHTEGPVGEEQMVRKREMIKKEVALGSMSKGCEKALWWGFRSGCGRSWEGEVNEAFAMRSDSGLD